MLSIGLANGRIVDYDLTKMDKIRTANLHRNNRVTAISSRGRHLVSSGQNGFTIVYDYAKQEVEREMELGEANIGSPTDLMVMENE